jgi:hypothetical protein
LQLDGLGNRSENRFRLAWHLVGKLCRTRLGLSKL